jgi:hypothetical protein
MIVSDLVICYSQQFISATQLNASYNRNLKNLKKFYHEIVY